MTVIIGLGNPEEKYKHTRHNVGSETVNYLAEAWDAPNLRENRKTKSRESSITVHEKKVTLAVPLTYMNESGSAVLALKNFYSLDTKDIWILHDDLDIEIGSYKIVYNRGPAGNNGIIDISQKLGTYAYYRWRIGIKSSEHSLLGMFRKKYVLSKLKKSEQEKINQIRPHIKESLELALLKNTEAAMNKYN